MMLLPWIVTSVTWPRLTSATKSENASVDCGPRVEDVWNRLKSATRSRPMTIQRARFLPKLFTLQAFPYRLGLRTRSNRAGVSTPAKDRMLLRLNNCKARSCKRVHRAEGKPRQHRYPRATVAEMRHRRQTLVIPQGRQNRIEQARQVAIAARRGGQAARPEIAERKAVRRRRHQIDREAPDPHQPGARFEPHRRARCDQLAQYQQAPVPSHEPAAAERARAIGPRTQSGAQPRKPRPPRRIARGTDAGGDPPQQPLGALGLGRRDYCRIE